MIIIIICLFRTDFFALFFVRIFSSICSSCAKCWNEIYFCLLVVCWRWMTFPLGVFLIILKRKSKGKIIGLDEKRSEQRKDVWFDRMSGLRIYVQLSRDQRSRKGDQHACRRMTISIHSLIDSPIKTESKVVECVVCW